MVHLPWSRRAMDTLPETIVAVSSPVGSSARAILRLSGPEAVRIALTQFEPDETVGPEATYRAFGGRVGVSSGRRTVRLPASLFVMRGPRSYTREDVAELHVAGSAAVVAEVTSALCRAGARAAAPGEFTARAFTSGRLDLAQAEGVMAVIAASGARSLSAAQRLLQGRLSDEVTALAARVRDLLARVELGIDFSEDAVPLVPVSEAGAAAAELRDAVVSLSRRCREVTHLDGDVRVALVGRPNVGKSSLFNALAGAPRAIVAEGPGTTRDELRESFTLAGSRFVLSDTAGLDDALADLDGGAAGGESRAVASAVSRAARAHALAALARSEVVLVVVEAGRVVGEASARADVRRLLDTLAAPAILVVNKCDLPDEGRWRQTGDRAGAALGVMGGGVRGVAVSARTGQGLDELRAALVAALRLGEVDRSAEEPAVAARHRRCLEAAAEGLERAVELCRGGGGGEELLALELREALDSLGRITGATSPQDVLSAIFAEFCIGK